MTVLFDSSYPLKSEIMKELIYIVHVIIREIQENHFFSRASENRRLRETIAVEIRFIESHIKLLTDQLADLDFSMENKQPGQQ